MKNSKLLPTILSIVSIAICWQLIALWVDFSSLFPTIPHLIKEIFKVFISEDFILALSATVLRGLIGFAIAMLLAFSLATIATFSDFWKSFFQPIIVTTRSIPVISVVLIALLWFSPTQLPVFIAMITMFPILYQNIQTGLNQTDKRLLEMAQVFGKTRNNQFRHIYLPSAKKNIFDGIKTAMGFGWRAIIIGEVLSQPLHGIGTSMKQAQVYINVPELIAWTVIAITVSYFFEFIIVQIQQFKFKKHDFKTATNTTELNTQNNDIKEIVLHNLTKEFNNISILKEVNVTFRSDKINYIKGVSGIGKTTLLKILSGIEIANTGEISKSATLTFSYLFQDIRLLPWLTVTENIDYILNKKAMNITQKNELISLLLERTELSECANKFPGELSGGQQQRVGLARALAANADVLILDEPLTGLDNELKIKITKLISEWILAYKPLVIWATHEEIVIDGIKSQDIVLQ